MADDNHINHHSVFMPPPGGVKVWDAAVQFPDGFALLIDRDPPTGPPTKPAVIPQRLTIEGWVKRPGVEGMGEKMFRAVVNLTGGTKVAPGA